MSIKILGIDPGTHVTGFGLLEMHNGDIRFIKAGALYLKKASLPERLFEMSLGLAEILKEFQPQALSLEKIFLGKNVDSAFKLGHARGVIMLEALRAECHVFEYANRAVKKNITGTGAADKTQLALSLKTLLQLKTLPQPVDASDALALAYYHAQEVLRQRVLSRAVEI